MGVWCLERYDSVKSWLRVPGFNYAASQGSDHAATLKLGAVTYAWLSIFGLERLVNVQVPFSYVIVSLSHSWERKVDLGSYFFSNILLFYFFFVFWKKYESLWAYKGNVFPHCKDGKFLGWEDIFPQS